MKTIVIILGLVVLTNRVCATAQFGDFLIYKGDTVVIFSNPLEIYFKEKGERTIYGKEMEGNCTALWRGYVATWEIENDELFLLRVQTDYCGDNPKDINLKDEFGSTKVFANWFTGEIRSQLGSLLSYVHMGYGSIYEREQLFQINNGNIVSLIDTSYVEIKTGQVHPGTDFLADTLYYLIFNGINTTYLNSILDREICQIAISFDGSGFIERIAVVIGENDSPLVKLILKSANSVLKDFPQLMKVNHKDYYPPTINLWFDAYCLKFPCDKEYGCSGFCPDDTLEKNKEISKNEANQSKNKKVFCWISIILALTVTITHIIRTRL